jgi:hypothetical protein
MLVDFNVVGQNIKARQLHGGVLGQLLGVVSGGSSAQDEASVMKDNLQVADSAAQAVVKGNLQMFFRSRVRWIRLSR